jgi:guanylate kinase
MKQTRGSLFVVSAPSGAGKTSLCRKLCETLPGVRHSVSYTTRAPRPGEEHDIHYTFVSTDTFKAMADAGEFVEWAEVHGNFYGTSRARIEGVTASGADVILDIDVQGARQIRRVLPDCLLIFILPPSMDALTARLTGRGSDAPEVIERRLKNALGEIREYKNYDYVIINDLFDEALTDLSSIIIAERLRTAKVNQDWITDHFLKEG